MGQFVFKLPDVGEGTAEAEIVAWHVRPGDVITAKSRLQNFEEREGRLGLTLYVFNETEWTNQRGEFVRRRVSTSIRY